MTCTGSYCDYNAHFNRRAVAERFAQRLVRITPEFGDVSGCAFALQGFADDIFARIRGTNQAEYKLALALVASYKCSCVRVQVWDLLDGEDGELPRQGLEDEFRRRLEDTGWSLSRIYHCRTRDLDSPELPDWGHRMQLLLTEWRWEVVPDDVEMG